MLSTLLALYVLAGAAAVPQDSPGRLPVETANPWTDGYGNPAKAGVIAERVAKWTVFPQLGAAIQPYNSKTSDPAVRVYLAPGYSGHPTMWERFAFQFPATPGPLADRVLVIAFHGFSTSEDSIFQTDIAAECAARGWYLLVPLGLVDVNYGNVQAQQAVDASLSFVQNFFEFNEDRIYGIGFSMGGGWALSYAARRQDTNGLRLAAVVNHTGTMDLIGTYETADPKIQGFMENPLVFGDTPTGDPFSYLRATPFDLLHVTPNVDAATVSNLLHIPIYHHVNRNETQLSLLAQNDIYKDYLVSKGATVSINEVTTPQPFHTWNTLDVADAFDYVGAQSLGPLPDHVELYADREVPYLFTHPRDIDDDVLARYHVTVDDVANAVTVAESKNLNVLALDLAAMGLDLAAVLTMDHETIDATVDEIVLSGYTVAPTSITVDGGAPFATSFDSGNQELSVTPTSDGSAAVVVITP